MSKRRQRMLMLLLIALFGAITMSTAITDDRLRSEPQKTEVVPTEWYALVKVVDGDTIDVLVASSTVRVRLIGLDTPEVVDPRQPVQCFGKEASAELKKVTGAGYVRIETDPTQGTFDTYGRLLAYVYVPANIAQEGILINKYMIAEGFGHEYTFDIPYKYQSDFKEAEKSARDRRAGLWAPGVCGEK